MRVKGHYEGAFFQFVVTAVLVCNFFVTIAESEQTGLSESGKLVAVDLAFVVFYTLELAVNLYTTRAVEFLCNPWSVFDFAVLAASLVELVLTYWGVNLALVTALSFTSQCESSEFSASSTRY